MISKAKNTVGLRDSPEAHCAARIICGGLTSFSSATRLRHLVHAPLSEVTIMSQHVSSDQEGCDQRLTGEVVFSYEDYPKWNENVKPSKKKGAYVQTIKN